MCQLNIYEVLLHIGLRDSHKTKCVTEHENINTAKNARDTMNI